MVDRTELRRRAYLGSVAAAATALAGCSSTRDGEASATAVTETATATATPTATATESPTATETTTEGPPADPAVRAVRVTTAPVRQTRPATVKVEVANEGAGPLTGAVALRVDGEPAGSTTVSLDGDSARTLTFDLRVPRVGDRELRATVSVDGTERAAATTTLTVERYPPSFVDRAGTDFVVDSTQFRYVGVNNNHLPVAQWGRQYVDRLLDYVAGHGVSVVRTWGFPPAWTDTELHPEPGRFRDDWFDHFDYVVLAAKRRGIRLVLPLVNNWYGPEHAPSTAAYADWSDTADSKNDFFDDEQATDYYHNYVEHFLTHTNQYTGVEYRADPTIMMWEVGNQMEYHGERRGEPLTDWYDAAARHIESVDDNHLVGTGMAGATGDVYERWNVRNAYVETHRSDAIDACCFHTYPIKRYQGDTTVRDQADFAEFVRTHVDEAHDQVGKPVYFGEFGAVVDPDAGLPVSKRDEFFETGTRVARETGLDGVQFWFAELRRPKGDASERRTHDDNPLAVFPDEASTWDVIEAYEQSLRG